MTTFTPLKQRLGECKADTAGAAGHDGHLARFDFHLGFVGTSL
jgi:hypothetical protein